MSETTVATPLSGEEIVEAMRQQLDLEVTKRLRRDCYLNPALAYEGFDADVHIQMHVRDNGRIELIDVRFHIEDRPPNVVREAAGLAIPTLVEDSTGKKEMKGVKYAQPQGKEAPPEEPPWEKLPGEEEKKPPAAPPPPPPPKPAEPRPSTTIKR